LAEVKNEKAPGQRCLADQTPLSGLEPSGPAGIWNGSSLTRPESCPVF